MIQTIFSNLLSKFTDDTNFIKSLVEDLLKNYKHEDRHYHTITHIEYLINILEPVKEDINDWDTLLFSILYHDIVYSPIQMNNEEKSALYAELAMKELKISEQMILKCRKQILATKSHLMSDDGDTNLFVDADLSILGSEKEKYLEYITNIRKEYAIFPDYIYKLGRKKVLQKFLTMDRIYKTDYFFDNYEITARINMQYELETL